MSHGSISLLLLLSLTCGFTRSQQTCPALDNTQVPWSTGEEMINSGECRDKTTQCSSCVDLCEDDSYSHWMTENCPDTCGLCTPQISSQAGSESQAAVWRYGEGYEDSNVLFRETFTTVKACQDKCLADKSCVGAFLTEYTKLSRMECVLAKSGSLVKRKYMFGVTRQMLEENPGSSCDDHWKVTLCQRFQPYCTSRCPYLRVLTNSVCPKTCNICQEEDEEEGTEEQDEEETQWSTQSGKRMVGDIAAKNLSVEEAKMKCCEMGEGCKGVTCRRENCRVMKSVKYLKTDRTFVSYTKM